MATPSPSRAGRVALGVRTPGSKDGPVKIKSAKQKRHYPAVTLFSALRIAQKIKEFNGGTPWTPSDVALAVGLGAKSPNFYYLTAASRDFALTLGTRDSETIALTELGREIVYAPDQDTEHRKKFEAFLKIDLFKKVLDHEDLPGCPARKSGEEWQLVAKRR